MENEMGDESVNIQGLCIASIRREPFDIVFKVGSQKTRFLCHKTMFCENSRVFFRLYGTLNEEPIVINIEDVSKEAFLIIVRYVYQRELFMRFEYIVEVLLLASRYQMMKLKSEVLFYVNQRINDRNAVSILSQFEHFNERLIKGHHSLQKVKQIALNTIDKFGICSLLGFQFSMLRKDTIALILERDTLRIKEFTLIQCAIAWAKDECGRRNLEQNLENIRMVLGSVFYLIRFPLLTIEDLFAVYSSGLLIKEDEFNLLLNYLIETQKPTLPFNTLSRAELGYKLNRFKNQKVSTEKHKPREFHQIDIKVTQNIRLVAIGVYMPKGYQEICGSLAMFLELYNSRTQQRIAQMSRRMICGPPLNAQIFQFVFTSCIFLQPNHRYSIVLCIRYFNLRRNIRDFIVIEGTSGKPTITQKPKHEQKVVWTFKMPKVTFGPLARERNKSNIFSGQFPEIIYDLK
ncbi:BTB/POZ domain-containing protein 1-like protein [Dinothrombium tinctorium]|uniref:BTB/POZ domain-containing protein 1-like protein n=1 Tax=Dinothrombium tinctorium TaxID=1965070 RepID=A0A3S3NKL7_9ACAR|nr:BTB/POZ domain-containing protein 1-like protein [Dinothrombium tinctorium]RWS08832.1 BTB/POZ domain-containing protein 1-like protein [Dinothrombium tinctorium]RWS08889.1 BTB/POZ domain-containing protein 1-like protein [Dinothrombium tinctorium]